MDKKDFKIHKDAEFAIFTSGLMGEKYIEVAGGSENSPYFK